MVTGWLSPGGVFYPCADYEHDDTAEDVLHTTSDELFHRGWVHVGSIRGVTCERVVSQAQLDTLWELSVEAEGAIYEDIMRFLIEEGRES